MKPSMEQIKADPESRRSGIDCDYCDMDIGTGVKLKMYLPIKNIKGKCEPTVVTTESYTEAEINICTECLYDAYALSEKY